MNHSYSDISQSFKAWILVARPKTLTASLVPIIVATCLAFAQTNSFKWWIVWDTFFAALCIQIGTNLINDALDFKKGADTEKRIGPKRATQMGWLSTQQVLAAGSACFFLSIAFGIPLIVQGGWPIFLVLFLSVVAGYLYTAGPYPLAYTGLGDIFVLLFFGQIATMAVFFLQAGVTSFGSFVAGTQIGMLCTVLLAVNNLRDVEGDFLVGKKTLAVIFGKTFAKTEISALVFLSFVLNVYWMYEGMVLAGILPFLSLPLAAKLVRSVWRTDPSSVYNRYLAEAALLHLLFGLFLSLGFLLK